MTVTGRSADPSESDLSGSGTSGSGTSDTDGALDSHVAAARAELAGIESVGVDEHPQRLRRVHEHLQAALDGGRARSDDD